MIICQVVLKEIYIPLNNNINRYKKTHMISL